MSPAEKYNVLHFHLYLDDDGHSSVGLCGLILAMCGLILKVRMASFYFSG